MHIALDRTQRHGQGVVIGGDGAAVAADEAQDRPALALAGVVGEVADDHAERVEVPVEGLDVLRGLHHDVSEPLHVGGHPWRALRRVGPDLLVAEVEHVRRLRGGQCLELMGARHHAHRQPARVDQINGQPAQRLRQRAHGGPGRVGQPHQIGLLGGHKRRPEKLLALAAADQHTRRAGVAAAQVQLVLGAQRRGETKGVGKRLGLDQVRLLELQPENVVHLDDRVGRAPRVLSRECALLAVQTVVRSDDLFAHR